jgi:hypothetical protein
MLKQRLKNQKGIATMESTLLLTIFVVFMTYCIGFFGVVHTGILNSISARAYTFETFRNRANVTYFRDSLDQIVIEHYARFGYRAHAVLSEKAPRGQSGSEWYVTERSIAQGRESPPVNRRPNPNQMDQLPKRETSGVNPVWIKTTYGICLNERCGDS